LNLYCDPGIGTQKDWRSYGRLKWPARSKHTGDPGKVPTSRAATLLGRNSKHLRQSRSACLQMGTRTFHFYLKYQTPLLYTFSELSYSELGMCVLSQDSSKAQGCGSANQPSASQRPVSRCMASVASNYGSSMLRSKTSTL
jgi:hypothetical protein